MKLKIALFFSIVILSIFLIYLSTIDKSISYVAIGDFLTVGVTAGEEENHSFTDYVYEYLNEKNVVNEYIKNFSDESLITNSTSRMLIDNCVRFGLINGFEDGTFRPNATLTRAQASKMVYTAIYNR